MSEQIIVSVVIPAHNEEKYVKRCIKSVKQAAEFFGKRTEIIVVCNRCTDRTEQYAKACGARTVINNDRCIALVRNSGIASAHGKIIMTIDCDNRMTRGTIKEAYMMMCSGKYIGGGAPIRFERYSFPIWLNDMMCRAMFRITGEYCGIFWTEKSVFDAIGGFVDKRAFEDAATAKLLKEYGKKYGKKYTCLRFNHLINSTRKYDELGDWLYFKLMIKNAGVLLKAAFGDSSGYDRLLDEMFYDYN